jgi:uncharacterized protein YbaA (DUF1428 family)
MAYVDGFVLAVPKAKLEDYRAFTRTAREVWLEHGACAYLECVGDEIPDGELAALPHAVQPADDEIAVLSWIVYDSKDERDRIHSRAMADPRLECSPEGFLDGRHLIEDCRHSFVEV